MASLREGFSKETWSPYLAGGLLGLVGILAVGLANNLLGASGSFESVAGTLGKAIAPGVFDNVYFNFIMPPGLNWQMVLLVGVLLGGFFGAWSARKLGWSWLPEKQWVQVFGPQRWKRWAIAFLGAIVLEYGAGIAGGCTSGLAISGGMLLAPAAFLFIAGMFASGIVTSLLVYRSRW